MKTSSSSCFGERFRMLALFARLFAGVLVFASVWPAKSQGWEGGARVVVVFNERVPASKAIADHYAEVRKVPGKQVLGLVMPTGDTITRDEFNASLQEPLLKFLEREKLLVFDGGGAGERGRKIASAQVRHVVLCYGVPYRILPDAKLVTEEVLKLRPELRRNEAAVDSELALAPLGLAGAQLAGPYKNPFYGSTNGASMSPVNGLLIVARLDGPTPEIARSLVDKALQAESEGLWGRAYFDLRGLSEGEYRMGDDSLGKAALAAQRYGFEAVVDSKPGIFAAGFPMSQIALYAGWYADKAEGAFGAPEMEFMPGAIGYHLHSFSAAKLRSTNDNWVGPMLAKGVTATLGSVDEPYLSGTPDMAAFVSRLLQGGMSFGEAAYACQVALSWQTTVVGDPLYRPFAKGGQALHLELEKARSPLLAWSHLQIVNRNLATGVATNEMIGYLRQLPLTKASSVLSEKLGDLLLGEKKISDAVDAYTRAMRAPTTQQQAIRLLLALAENQAALERDDQALETYQIIIKKIPGFPGMLNVYEKALPLTEKLKRTADADDYRREIARLKAAK